MLVVQCPFCHILIVLAVASISEGCARTATSGPIGGGSPGKTCPTLSSFTSADGFGDFSEATKKTSGRTTTVSCPTGTGLLIQTPAGVTASMATLSCSTSDGIWKLDDGTTFDPMGSSVACGTAITCDILMGFTMAPGFIMITDVMSTMADTTTTLTCPAGKVLLIQMGGMTTSTTATLSCSTTDGQWKLSDGTAVDKTSSVACGVAGMCPMLTGFTTAPGFTGITATMPTVAGSTTTETCPAGSSLLLQTADGTTTATTATLSCSTDDQLWKLSDNTPFDTTTKIACGVACMVCPSGVPTGAPATVMMATVDATDPCNLAASCPAGQILVGVNGDGTLDTAAGAKTCNSGTGVWADAMGAMLGGIGCQACIPCTNDPSPFHPMYYTPGTLNAADPCNVQVTCGVDQSLLGIGNRIPESVAPIMSNNAPPTCDAATGMWEDTTGMVLPSVICSACRGCFQAGDTLGPADPAACARASGGVCVDAISFSVTTNNQIDPVTGAGAGCDFIMFTCPAGTMQIYIAINGGGSTVGAYPQDVNTGFITCNMGMPFSAAFMQGNPGFVTGVQCVT